MNDTMKLPGGVFELTVYKDKAAFERGEVLRSIKTHNKMTNASLAAIAGLIANTGAQTAFTYIGLGSSNTAVSAAHTGLQSEIIANGLTRTPATISRTTTAQANDTISFVKVFTATGTSSIEEVGIFNASSAGTMLCRALTGTLNAVNNNVITVTYTFQLVGN